MKKTAAYKVRVEYPTKFWTVKNNEDEYLISAALWNRHVAEMFKIDKAAGVIDDYEIIGRVYEDGTEENYERWTYKAE